MPQMEFREALPLLLEGEDMEFTRYVQKLMTTLPA